MAQDNIDEVIKIIRSSYDNAKENLMARFGLDDIQAQAICDMRLIALQGLNREKLEAEYKELEEKIAYYNRSSPTRPGPGDPEGGAAGQSPTSSATTGSPRSRTWRTRSTSRT